MGNVFSIGEIVRFRGSKKEDRLEGVVKFITCSAATQSGGRTCDRNNCTHNPKDRIWVKWPDGSLCSYKNHELENDLEGEEAIFNDMSELLDTEEDAEATNVIKAIIKSRKNREQPTEVRSVKMSSKNNGSFMDMIKADAGNAAYRVAAKQINTGVRNAFIEVLKSKGASNDHVAAVASFLETEWGAAFLGTLVGHGLNYVPGLKDDARVQRLSEEFRISGITTVGNEVFGLAMGSLLPIITSALKALPAETEAGQITEGHKSTVEEVEIEVETDLSDLEDHMEKEEEKRMVLNG